MGDFWARLKQRKLMQWALAYIAATFAFLQGIDIVAQRFGWPDAFERLNGPYSRCRDTDRCRAGRYSR
jgi:hypothetical protein